MWSWPQPQAWPWLEKTLDPGEMGSCQLTRPDLGDDSVSKSGPKRAQACTITLAVGLSCPYSCPNLMLKPCVPPATPPLLVVGTCKPQGQARALEAWHILTSLTPPRTKMCIAALCLVVTM